MVLTLDDGQTVPLQMGDVVDLGPQGVILTLIEEDAEAYRLWWKKRTRDMQRVMKFVQIKQNKKIGESGEN